MIVFEASAVYERHLRSVIAVELARIGRDVKFRERMDADLERLAPIATECIDPHATGRLVILFGVAEPDAFIATEALQGARRVRETSPL